MKTKNWHRLYSPPSPLAVAVDQLRAQQKQPHRGQMADLVDALEQKRWVWEKIIKPKLVIEASGCWEWNFGNLKGYGKLRVGPHHFEQNYFTHRVALEVHMGKELGELFACHKCDNPKCNNPEHLFAGTRRDNTDDSMAKMRTTYGEKNPGAKLTDESVLAMRSDYESGCGSRFLASKYGVGQSNVWCVVKRKSWRHI